MTENTEIVSIESETASNSAQRNLKQPSALMQSIVVGALMAALIILTLTGVGVTILVCVIGIALCVLGFFQRTIKVDWWILAPLLIYLLFSMLASYNAYGSFFVGYTAVQLIFPVIYGLLGCLGGPKRSLVRQLSVLWVGIAAAYGIIRFVTSIFWVSATRLDYVVGSPNALAIFLVLGWFALTSCKMELKSEAKIESRLVTIISYFEPIILTALALTLSMGSFVALFIGIIVLVLGQKRGQSWSKVFQFGIHLLSKAILGLIVGLLMYMAAERANAPLLAAAIFAYLIVLAACWKTFEDFLEAYKPIAVAITISGLFFVLVAIIMRPSSLATFAERFHMMQNGLGYMVQNPLLGVGPYKWRGLNLADADTYFNTNHIHNIFIHIGTELGVFAALCLVVIAIRCFILKSKEAQHGEDAAFLFHLLIDTGFFYLGVVSLFIMTAGNSTRNGVALGPVATKIFFGLLGILYIWFLVFYTQMAMR